MIDGLKKLFGKREGEPEGGPYRMGEGRYPPGAPQAMIDLLDGKLITNNHYVSYEGPFVTPEWVVKTDDDWRPIETAPKDETVVLLWDGTDVTPAACYKFSPSYRETWLMRPQTADEAHEVIFPTHWMPLPEPPR